MTKPELQQWAENLPFEERFKVQRFMVQLYAMEANDERN